MTKENIRCCRVKAELEKFYKCVKKLQEKAQQIDVKVGSKQQTEKTDNRKSTTLHEDFIKGLQEYFDETGKAEVLTRDKSQLNSGLSQRLVSIKTLSQVSNQSNDLKNQQLRQKIAELRIKKLKN